MPATATPAAPRPSGAGPRPYSKRTRGTRPGQSGSADRHRGRSDARPKAEDHEILFQKFFKSVGPRTYAAQVKRAVNGNHYLVLMEGKRDEKTGEVRKTRLFIYSEDFVEFFRLVKSTAEFIKVNPVPEEVRTKREKFWRRQNQSAAPAASSAPVAVAPMTPSAR